MVSEREPATEPQPTKPKGWPEEEAENRRRGETEIRKLSNFLSSPFFRFTDSLLAYR